MREMTGNEACLASGAGVIGVIDDIVTLFEYGKKAYQRLDAGAQRNYQTAMRSTRGRDFTPIYVTDSHYGSQESAGHAGYGASGGGYGGGYGGGAGAGSINNHDVEYESR